MNVKALTTFVALLGMVGAFIAYIASLGIGISAPKARTNLSIEVIDVNNIVTGSNVLLRGVPVGKVTGIDTSIATATIHFYIKNEYKIPVDSVISLENLSALGEAYIELQPRRPDGPMLRDGQHITTESVTQPSSISELAVSVVRVMNQLDPGQLHRVIGEADTALPDPDAVLPNLQRASLLLRNTTVDSKSQGQQLLANLQSLLENAGFVGPLLADATPLLRAVGPQIKETLDYSVAAAVRVDFPGCVYIAGRLLKRIQQLLDQRGPDIRVLTEPLTANVQAIAASLASIDSSQVLSNLLATVPENGAIDLHVRTAEGGAGN